MYQISYYEMHLGAHANRKLANQRRREAPTLRGVLGIPYAELTQLIAESELAELPKDLDTLNALYSRSLEEGLIAIALVAVSVLEQPQLALELAERWLPYVDDVQTADALGHLVIGPALLSLGLSSDERLQDPELTNPFHRRAEVMALMAAMPEPVRGPAAAALRETLQADEITFVEEAMDAHIANGLLVVLRDPSPIVRKAFSSVLRAWTACSHDAVQAWVSDSVPDRHPWVKDGLSRGLREHRRRMRKKDQ